jgi:NADP-dependent 3-hydroxy acid dehydrogenase YdfG
MTDLSGRTILILGASAGIGRSLAVSAAAAGAELLLCGRRQDSLREVREEAGRGTALAVDVTDASQVASLAVAAAEAGPIDGDPSTAWCRPSARRRCGPSPR